MRLRLTTTTSQQVRLDLLLLSKTAFYLDVLVAKASGAACDLLIL